MTADISEPFLRSPPSRRQGGRSPHCSPFVPAQLLGSEQPGRRGCHPEAARQPGAAARFPRGAGVAAQAAAWIPLTACPECRTPSLPCGAWESHPPARCTAAPNAAGAPRSGPGAAVGARRGEPSRRPPAWPGSGRACGAWRRSWRWPAPRPFPSPRSTPGRPPSGQPGWTNWTGSWAAGWCRGRWCCWPASPGSASPRSCWRPARSRRSRARCCTSPVRNPRRRCGCGRTGSGPSGPVSTSPPRRN